MPDTSAKTLWARATRGGLHSPIWAVVLTVLLAVIGVAASVFSPEIRAAWPFSAWTFSPNAFSLAALVFWAGLVATAFLFLARQVQIDERREDIDGRLETAVGDVTTTVKTVQTSSDLLHKVIRTMPPAAFLQVFDAVYEECEAQTWAAIVTEAPQRADLVDAVRVVLHGFLKLIRQYDQPWSTQAEDEPGRVRYAANVMLYLPVEHLSATDHEAARDGYLKFWDGADHDLAGVLDLRADLSAASDSGQEDVALTPFCIPVPRVPKSKLDDGRALWRTLPGAPMAFVTRRPTHFRETTQLAHWCADNGDFRQTVRSDIGTYFLSEAGRRVQSLVAYPLTRVSRVDTQFTESEDTGTAPIGVLNIHADVLDLLDGDEAQSFYTTTFPMRLLLLRLLDRMRDLNEFCEAGRWLLTPSLESALNDRDPPADGVVLL